MKITHIHSPIVSADDYYPFGLAIQQHSYQRESAVKQSYKFNGVELNSVTGNYEMTFRGYDPAIGRFMQIDPLADIIPSINSYSFGFNNPIDFVDPLGLMGSKSDERKRKKAQRLERKRARKAARQKKKAAKKGQKTDQFGGTRGSSGNNSNTSFVAHDAIWLDNVDVIGGEISSDSWINDPRKRDPLYWTSDYWQHFINGHNRSQAIFGEIALEIGMSFIPVGRLASLGVKGIRYAGFSSKLSTLVRGGKTFQQYKAAYWAKRVKPALDPIINPRTGQVWKQYVELHHRFIPQRWQKIYNLPNWLVNNRINLRPLSSLRHAMVDPYRARFTPSWIKDTFKLKWR